MLIEKFNQYLIKLLKTFKPTNDIMNYKTVKLKIKSLAALVILPNF